MLFGMGLAFRTILSFYQYFYQQIRYMASITLPEDNYFNPIRLRIKKTTSNKPKADLPTTNKPITIEPPNTSKQIRFRDLSKDKTQYFTQRPIQQHSFRELSKQDSPLNSVRKRLFGNDGASTPRERSLSFSDVIKLSREKRLRESKSKGYLKKQQGKSEKKGNGKAFNALKTRLLGQNNPNAANIIKPPIHTHSNQESAKHSPIQRPRPPKPKSLQEDMDIVRTSTQLQPFNLNTSLAMSPL